MNFLTYLEKKSKLFCIVIGVALIGLIGFVDFLTGYELAFSVFYVIPISLTTWFVGQRVGLVTSLVGAFVWVSADIAAGHPYSHPYIPIWNTIIRLAFFVLITILLSSMRRAAEREKELARIDYLTGAANSRFFYELVLAEIYRLNRYGHPFTLAHIDLDDFKNVNDQFGHSIGDQVLRTIVNTARKHLRKTDLVARLGGDEFALVLPETDQKSARDVLPKIQCYILAEMQQCNWPITLSIGVLTCSNDMPLTTVELVSKVDDLMYSVKRNGKNAIIYSTFAG